MAGKAEGDLRVDQASAGAPATLHGDLGVARQVVSFGGGCLKRHRN